MPLSLRPLYPRVRLIARLDWQPSLTVDAGGGESIGMVTLVMALGLLFFLRDFKTEHAATFGGNVAIAIRGISMLLAVGTLLLALGSIVETERPGSPGAFRTGSLVPWYDQDAEDGYRPISVLYVQKSWWGWRKDGEWTARPGDNGGWEYEKAAGEWRDVPEEVFRYVEDDREFATDNRGSHEVQ